MSITHYNTTKPSVPVRNSIDELLADPETRVVVQAYLDELLEAAGRIAADKEHIKAIHYDLRRVYKLKSVQINQYIKGETNDKR